MRKWVLRVHLYGGLLCAAYLILFGVSSLMFNHPGMWPAGKGKVNWERAVEVSSSMGDDATLSEAIRDELGLMGWTIPWETRRVGGNVLTFGVSRPGKHYKIDYDPAAKSVKVVETRKGYGEVVRALHGFMRLPNSWFVSTWGMYTEVCTWVVLFAAASGVYLWAGRRNERRVGLAMIGGAVATVAFMVFITVRG